MAGEPAAERRVPFVGLTGGMGAGKSEALRALEALGAATLSSDAVVHELLMRDDVRAEMVARLGPEVAPGGVLDRGAIASVVFERPEERAWLEGFLWPRVGERVAAWREELARRPEPPVAAVVEVPLLFEAGMEAVFDATIAVVADDAIRERRTEGRLHAGSAGREARQLSQEEKAQRADFVVRNDGTLAELRERLSDVLATLGT